MADNWLLNRISHFLFTNGPAALSCFFVLSGFLITYLLLAEQDRYGRIHLKNYYIRRSLRIWPLYFLHFAIVFLLLPFLLNQPPLFSRAGIGLWPFYTFLDNFGLLEACSSPSGLAAVISSPADLMMYGISWSVAIEEQFYLLWPLLFACLPPRWYPAVFTGIIAASFIYRILHEGDGLHLHFHTLSVMADMGIGGCSAYLVSRSKRFRQFISSLGKKQVVYIYLAFLALGIIGYDVFTFPYAYLLTRLLFCLFFVFLILEQSFNPNSAFKLRNNRWMSRMGQYTYGAYLWHTLALYMVQWVLLRYSGMLIEEPLGMFIYSVSALLLCFVLTYCSYHYYEQVFLKWKDKFAFFHKK